MLSADGEFTLIHGQTRHSFSKLMINDVIIHPNEWDQASASEFNQLNLYIVYEKAIDEKNQVVWFYRHPSAM